MLIFCVSFSGTAERNKTPFLWRILPLMYKQCYIIKTLRAYSFFRVFLWARARSWLIAANKHENSENDGLISAFNPDMVQTRVNLN